MIFVLTTGNKSKKSIFFIRIKSYRERERDVVCLSVDCSFVGMRQVIDHLPFVMDPSVLNLPFALGGTKFPPKKLTFLCDDTN